LEVVTVLHYQDPAVAKLLLRGNFGLEKESLRVTPEGYFAHTPHPFPNNDHIVRDFCENQTEINTPVFPSAQAAVNALAEYNQEIQEQLSVQPQRELLWPFSNPPLIQNEADVPVAQFAGGRASKTSYREYLSDRYGRYKMALCGIHVNFSFADELLEADFAASGEDDFTEYKNQLYVNLAEQLAAYGWILTAVTAASPLTDSSYVEKGHLGGDNFGGMASVRCSELGYWNFFAPLFDYSNIRSYADSIQHYVDEGMLAFPTELYYPIRLKPAGLNRLNVLRDQGVNHIELRMFDLNPLAPAGVDVRDVQFAQLLMVWLLCRPVKHLSHKAQVQAVQNFKNAAHYDLKTVKIVLPGEEATPVADAALSLLAQMKGFYRFFPAGVREVLIFEEAKFLDPETRYAWQIRREFADGYVQKGLKLADALQREAVYV
jgi:glutamate--cysteine ligase